MIGANWIHGRRRWDSGQIEAFGGWVPGPSSSRPACGRRDIEKSRQRSEPATGDRAPDTATEWNTRTGT